MKGTITVFDGVLWDALVDYITVYEDGHFPGRDDNLIKYDRVAVFR